MAARTFRTWTVRGAQLPVAWDQVHERFRWAPTGPALTRDLDAGSYFRA